MTVDAPSGAGGPVFSLRGHRSPVHAVELDTSDPRRLLSASADGTVRAWDLETGRAVAAIASFPSAPTCVRIEPGASSPLVYVSHGGLVSAHDLRAAGGGPVTGWDRCAFSIGSEEGNGGEDVEEINSIAVNERGCWLAVGDDGGRVKVYDIRAKAELRAMRDRHENVRNYICSSVSFRPNRPWELYSAGFDRQLIKWDLSRGAVSAALDFNEPSPPPPSTTMDASTATAVPASNPRFVHSVEFSADGRRACMGLGDGTLALLTQSPQRRRGGGRSGGGTLGLDIATTDTVHNWCVTCARFVNDNASNIQTFVASGSLDGTVAVWNVVEGGAADGRAPLVEVGQRTAVGRKVDAMAAQFVNGGGGDGPFRRIRFGHEGLADAVVQADGEGDADHKWLFL
ncbi:WD repeat-containing protein 53 [Irineochytrium annulatum]|nr:WD repeat-containing protein 53 [Irineochytrium annulatum]